MLPAPREVAQAQLWLHFSARQQTLLPCSLTFAAPSGRGEFDVLEKLPRTCADLDVFSYAQIQNPSSLFFSASQASLFPNVTMCLSIGDSWDDHLHLQITL